MVDLQKHIPSSLQPPSRLRLLTVTIHYYISYDKDVTAQYYLLFTIANWHHIEVLLVLDRNDNIQQGKILRMFERIPWELGNYVKIRRHWQRSQFAVPYVNYELGRQVVAIYEADWIVTPINNTVLAENTEIHQEIVEVPLVPILGVHRVMDTYEVAFAFHSRGLDTLLFTDMDGYNITEL